MKIAVFSTKSYDKDYLDACNQKYNFGHDLVYFTAHLNAETASLAQGFQTVCCFVNDQIDSPTLQTLTHNGTHLIALRSAGFNHVDLVSAAQYGIKVVRVPAYSPYAVAEHTIGLILTLNRKIHRAYSRIREGNFSIEGLMGFDIHSKTVGVVGTGKIGAIVVDILSGFGCHIIAHDPHPNPSLNQKIKYVPLDELFCISDIITLHCPLTPQTHHIVNYQSVQKMKPGIMLINTSRGGLIDTRAVIEGLKSKRIGYLGLDVYEEEAELFFDDLSSQIIQDDIFTRLLTFPNVVITGHQAFFTQEALKHIAYTTLQNIQAFEKGEILINQVKIK